MPTALGVLAALLVAWLYLDRGWVPHDEGLLGQAAERTLQGEWPHRDFIDTYTGGQARWHALAMRVLGVNALAMRWAMLPFFAAFVAAVFAMARRVVTPLAALGCAGLAVLLTLPNYPAPMPSWYGLFLAVVGTWCGLQGLRSRRGSWWLMAGVMGGLSVLFKITGLYFIAAMGLLLFEHERSLRAVEANDQPLPGARLWVALLTTACAAGLAVLALGVGLDAEQPLATAWHFGLPFLAWLGVLAATSWRDTAAPSLGSLRLAGGHAALFLLGALLPVAAFTLPYAGQGELLVLFEGVFVLPMRRMQDATQPLPAPSAIPLALIWVALFVGDSVAVPRRRVVLLVTTIALLALLLIPLRGGQPQATSLVFTGLRQLLPAVVLVAALQRWRARRAQPELVALVSLALLSSLIQVPFAGPLYFLHFAPTVVLALAVLLRPGATRHRSLHALLLGFVLVFGILNLGWTKMPWLRGEEATVRTAPLALERAPLEVGWYDAEVYDELLRSINALTTPGDTILALPDSPEVYHLSRTRNPTPWFYEFLADPERMDLDHYVRLINEQNIRVMVVNEQHRFSGPLPHRIAQHLKRGFDHHESITVEHRDPRSGETASTVFFTIHWRGPAPTGEAAP